MSKPPPISSFCALQIVLNGIVFSHPKIMVTSSWVTNLHVDVISWSNVSSFGCWVETIIFWMGAAALFSTLKASYKISRLGSFCCSCAQVWKWSPLLEKRTQFFKQQPAVSSSTWTADRTCSNLNTKQTRGKCFGFWGWGSCSQVCWLLNLLTLLPLFCWLLTLKNFGCLIESLEWFPQQVSLRAMRLKPQYIELCVFFSAVKFASDDVSDWECSFLNWFLFPNELQFGKNMTVSQAFCFGELDNYMGAPSVLPDCREQ